MSELFRDVWTQDQMYYAVGPTPFESSWTPEPYQKFIYAVSRIVKPRTTVEIGLEIGASTESFLRSLRDNGYRSELCSIEIAPWPYGIGIGQSHARYPVSWRFINSSSQEARKGMPDRIDMLYIDGDHTPSGVSNDFQSYCDISDVILFDDTHCEGPGELVARLESSREWDVIRADVLEAGQHGHDAHMMAVVKRKIQFRPEGVLSKTRGSIDDLFAGLDLLDLVGPTPFETGWYHDENNSESAGPYRRTIYSIVRLIKPRTVVEIGLDGGKSCEAIMTALHAIGEEATLWSMELKDWTIGLEIGQRLARHPVSWNFLQGDSRSLRGRVPEKYDLLYIDGGHTEAEALADFALYADGAQYILFDDIQVRGPGAIVQKLERDPEWQVVRVPAISAWEDSSPAHTMALARRRKIAT